MRLAPALPLRRPIVLAVDLSRPVSDDARPSRLGALTGGRRPPLRALVQALADAAEDPRVWGLLARVDHPARTWAHAEELRDAVIDFRRSGKPALAHAQSFGELRDGTLAYFVACAFGDVALQPSGDLGLLGLAAEVPFAAELLDRLGVAADIDHREEYKTAANLFTERGFTAAHREAVERILASHHEQLVAAIAGDRGIDAERAAASIDAGPLRAAEALEAGLVDRLAYRDEVVAAAKASAGARSRLMSPEAYRRARRRRPWPRPQATVALVHGQGAILLGRSRRGLLGPTMGADTIATGLQQALRSRRVAAVLLRIDSPGGSAAASDAIWRAVVRAREAGKPVVVSMGALAGSGGYWVAMDADRIVASPGTLTGSIGVVAGKLVTGGLLERAGIHVEAAQRGANARMFSTQQRFTQAQRERLAGFLDAVYDEFVRKVADGRGLAREHVHEVARGRVWTGADAAERGLVDRLGGGAAALDELRSLLGLPAGARLRLRVLPRERLAERLGLRPPQPEEAGVAAGLARRLAAGGAELAQARMPEWSQWLR